MAIALSTKTNVEAPSTDYPFGNIKDNSGIGDGTPINKQVYADFHQFFAKLFAASGLTYNGQPDNNANGFQYYDALMSIVGGARRKVIEIGTWNMSTTDHKVINISGIGIAYSQIIGMNVMISNDVDTSPDPIFTAGAFIFLNNSMVGQKHDLNDGGGTSHIRNVSGGEIWLDRGSYYSVMNTGSGNRGWIILDYLP